MCRAGCARWGLGIAVLLVVFGLPAIARAGDEVAAASAASTTPATPSFQGRSGDNAWLLTSSALVLMMTGPGLALFYCGLVRKKNVLSVMMQCIFLMCLMSVIWALYGFALSFGNDPAVVAKDNRRPMIPGTPTSATSSTTCSWTTSTRFGTKLSTSR